MDNRYMRAQLYVKWGRPFVCAPGCPSVRPPSLEAPRQLTATATVAAPPRLAPAQQVHEGGRRHGLAERSLASRSLMICVNCVYVNSVCKPQTRTLLRVFPFARRPPLEARAGCSCALGALTAAAMAAQPLAK